MEEAAATYAYPLMLQGGPRHLILKTLGWVRAALAFRCSDACVALSPPDPHDRHFPPPSAPKPSPA